MSALNKRPPASIIFIFGGSGDLNLRKLTPALYNLSIDDYLPNKFAVYGIGRSNYSNEQYHERLKEGLVNFSRRNELDKNWDSFAQYLNYLQMDADDAEAYNVISEIVLEKEKEWLTHPNVIFYMSVAPQLVPQIATNLGKQNICNDKRSVRIVVEKPFGNGKTG